MQYLKYFENYDEKGLIKRFYENALHHDDVNALNKVSNKYNVNPLDFIDIEEIIEYNAGNIFEYLFDQFKIDFNFIGMSDIIDEGKLKIVKVLYNHNYFIDYINILNELNIRFKGITTLEGVEIFKNLEKLSCIGNDIQSLEPIQYLKKLKELDCSANAINSLEPLKHLKKLNTLECSHNKITTLEPLRKLKRLKILNCAYNNITSLKPIDNLLNKIEIVLIENPLDQESEELLKKYDLE